MQDMIAAGVTWFEAQRREHMAVNVDYQPVVDGEVTVPATVGGSRFESVDAAGQILRFETRDYVIAVQDYAPNPVRGDRIREVDQNGIARIYEVMVPAGAGNPWQWADRSQRARRIHTILVEVP